MDLELIPVDKNSSTANLVRFVNQHYASPLPLEEGAISSGNLSFFWAQDRKTKQIVGVSGYQVKTPYLVETIKTVVDSQFRGHGLGARISELIENEVRARGFKKIMSTIYVTNLPMIFIKLKQGYLFEGFHPNHEKPGLHEYSFGKVLG